MWSRFYYDLRIILFIKQQLNRPYNCSFGSFIKIVFKLLFAGALLVIYVALTIPFLPFFPLSLSKTTDN